MAVMYRSQDVLVRKAYFSNAIVVIDLHAKRKVVAPEAVAMRCAVLMDVQAQIDLSVMRRAFVVQYIFERFAATVLHPNSLPASMFLTNSPDRFLSAAVLASDPETVAAMMIKT